MSPGNEFRSRIDNPQLRQKRRSDLIRCASRLFVEKGFAQTTMDEIAAAMGISKPSLYNYVGSKEEVVYLTMDYAHQVVSEQFEAIRRDLGSRSAAGALQESIHIFIAIVDRLQEEYIFLNHVITSLDKEGRRKLLADAVYVSEYFEELLTWGNETGEFAVPNPKAIGSMIARLCSAWSHNRWYLRRILTVEEFTTQMTQFILSAVSAKTLAVPAAGRLRDEDVQVGE